MTFIIERGGGSNSITNTLYSLVGSIPTRRQNRRENLSFVIVQRSYKRLQFWTERNFACRFKKEEFSFQSLRVRFSDPLWGGSRPCDLGFSQNPAKRDNNGYDLKNKEEKEEDIRFSKHLFAEYYLLLRQWPAISNTMTVHGVIILI